MWGPRQQYVVAAVVFDLQREAFFVSFNAKWKGYAFPMSKRREETEEATALAALREAVELSLPQATARPLEYVEYRHKSGRTGEDTHYCYQAYEVDPHEPLPAGGLASRHGFLSTDQLLEGNLLVTWSTRVLVHELMDNQQVAVALLSRPGPGGREYLLLDTEHYHGYFFPASRRKTKTSPVAEAVSAIQRDTGYSGPLREGQPLRTRDQHVSPRFGRQRRFVYHLVPLALPGVSPESSLQALEESLDRKAVRRRWLSEAELADPATHGLSPTVAVIRPLLPLMYR